MEKAALVNVDPPNLDSLWEDSYYIVRNYGIHTCTVMAHTHSLTLTHPLSPPHTHTHSNSFKATLIYIHLFVLSHPYTYTYTGALFAAYHAL